MPDVGSGAAVGGAAIGGLSSLFGGGSSSDSGYAEAAAIIAKAMRDATAVQKSAYAQSLEAMYPWMSMGKQALGTYGSLLGMDMSGQTYPNSFALDASSPLYPGGPVGPAGAPGKMGRYGGENAFGGAGAGGTGGGGPIWPGMNTTDRLAYIRNTPGYQFELDQGLDAIERYTASKGQTLSGAHLKGISSYGQSTADKYFTQYMNQLAGLYGSGQQAAGSTGAAALNTGSNVGQTLMGGAQGMAQAAIGQGQANAAASQNSFNNLLTGGVLGGYGMSKLFNQPSNPGYYSDYNLSGLYA
jgi:hypothetical protein